MVVLVRQDELARHCESHNHCMVWEPIQSLLAVALHQDCQNVRFQGHEIQAFRSPPMVVGHHHLDHQEVS